MAEPSLFTKMAIENRRLRDDNQALKYKLARLVAYVINMQDDHPDLVWPDFPDNYPADMGWRMSQ